MNVFVVWGGVRDYESVVCVRSSEADARRIVAMLEEATGDDYAVEKFTVDAAAMLKDSGREVSIPAVT